MPPVITTIGHAGSNSYGQRGSAGIPDVSSGNQSFTSSGTFTLQSGVHYNNLIFRVYGAGGSGGGGNRSTIKHGNDNGAAGNDGVFNAIASQTEAEAGTANARPSSVGQFILVKRA